MAVLTYKSMPKQCEGQRMKPQKVDRKEDREELLDAKGGVVGSAEPVSCCARNNNRLDVVPQ